MGNTASKASLCYPRPGYYLFTMSKNPKSVLLFGTDETVEANGIEPMTSCLQSRRSPN